MSGSRKIKTSKLVSKQHQHGCENWDFHINSLAKGRTSMETIERTLLKHEKMIAP